MIKIRGALDENIYKEQKKIKEYVKDKIKDEIDPSFHTDLELFEINGNKIEVWVYIHAFPSEVTNDIIEKWIQDHIKEEGISVIGFEFKKIFDMTDEKDWKNKYYVRIPQEISRIIYMNLIKKFKDAM